MPHSHRRSFRPLAAIAVVVASTLIAASVGNAGAEQLRGLGRGDPQGPYRSRPTVVEMVEAGTLPGGAVRIDWQYSNDDTDIAGYLVRRDRRLIARVDSSTLTYVDQHGYEGPVGAGQPTYTVEAVDTTGLRSGESDPVTPRSAAVAPESADVTGTAMVTAAVSGYSAALRRYPYLTDTVNSNDGTTGYATVNWATDRSATTGSLRWGAVVAGVCTASTPVTATRTSISVNSIGLYQWKAKLSLQPDRQYCYRPSLGSVDLLGSNASPVFRTQVAATSTQAFSFAVLGDWGSADSTSSNNYQAAIMERIASSGVRFAITTGDNAYSSGSQSNYGDLVSTGPSLSAVFGRQFWSVAGASIPLFPTIGNHGYLRSDTNHPHLLNWPQDRAVATSAGRYTKDTYCCVLGTTSLSAPSTWYAFDAGPVRIYILQAAWSDSNGGVNGSPYEVDAAYQWQPTSPQYQWLKSDLAAHPTRVKMVAFHYPLYSDQKAETSDAYLRAPGSLQALLDQYRVKIAFNGHAHIYQRNRPDPAGMVSYVTGGGGAKLQSVHEVPCLAIDAYAIGWSNTKGAGNSCGAAPTPTSMAQVFHFLKVTVNGSAVTVAPTNSLGQTFDVQTFNLSP